ncbi:MAG: hypothetical protein IJT69_02040 [Clostridia bacterium]|nr:hypothetical protein [Clostridia bacterium]
MLNELKNAINVEEDFFETDGKNKKVEMRLRYDKPSDVFDENAVTKTPIFTSAFDDRIRSVVDYAPRGYKIDLHVTFASSEGYTEEDLKEIFLKNVALAGKRKCKQTHSKNLLALGLIVVGVLFFVVMLLLNNLWQGDSLAKQIFAYVSDIATTVTFWEAMVILIVENKETRDLAGKTIRKFDAVTFHVDDAKEGEESEIR